MKRLGYKALLARPRALSLIEILVAVAILIILLGIILAVGNVRGPRHFSQTKFTLSVLRSQMGEYLNHHGEPTAANWLDALKSEPAIARVLESLPHSNGKIVDGYGTPIEYLPSKTSPSNRPNGYFRSVGPDVTPDTVDDVYSDPVGNPD